MIDCAPATCDQLARTAPQLVKHAMPMVVAAAVAVGVGAHRRHA